MSHRSRSSRSFRTSSLSITTAGPFLQTTEPVTVRPQQSRNTDEIERLEMSYGRAAGAQDMSQAPGTFSSSSFTFTY